jgi:23S rRNA U2552 (ribose-2'-O)-methylase RlmE/FtsJ
MMKGIGFEMNNATGALSLGGDNGSCMQVLDLCVAPGGYSAAVLALNPTASIDAVSLPNHDGGHRVLIPFGRRDPRVRILFTDITMLATEYGVDLNNIPTGHPDAGKFKPLRPYEGKQYDLVLCDGQVLRTQKRKAYREVCEPARLTNAQLILGLQRIKPGGTLIILLHKVGAWDSMMLIRSFSAFATIKLFKPAKAHAIRSSFYMVAKNIQPQDTKAKLALEQYRKLWHRATFGCDRGLSGDEVTEDTAAVLEEFGPRLVELGREIWRVQADALEKAPFMQMSGGEDEAVGEAVRLEPSHLPSP